MAKYMTEQRKTLEKILTDNCESAYTVDELCEKMVLLYADAAPGKSTVYRLLTALVDDGSVKRFTSADKRCAAYQKIIGEHCERHLHLKCVECGKILHLDESTSDELLRRVQSSADFSVCGQSTVLFGKCRACTDKKQNGHINQAGI